MDRLHPLQLLPDNRVLYPPGDLQEMHEAIHEKVLLNLLPIRKYWLTVIFHLLAECNSY